ncbi:MAG TPA: DUF3794 domain-containing protein [Clostridiales bacterium]|nr:DUF3794 domain-containing protein [Clostridiales bacterium]
MELVKKNIHMNKLKCRSNLQLTLDDDFNVPDAKPDIERIITDQGEVRITEVKGMNGKVSVKGSLMFNVLYLNSQYSRPVHNISGEIPFDELINMEPTCADDEPVITWSLEDLSTEMINSRKLGVKSIIRLDVAIDELYDEETAVSVEDEDGVEFLSKKIELTDIAVEKRDTFRIKDDILLPANKGNISSVLYYDIHLNYVEVRMLEDKFTIKGELPVFILYTSEDEENPIQYYETEIPFGGTIECSGCTEEMIEDITFSIINKSLTVTPDGDGEERAFDIEIILDMNIRAYEVEEPEILCDVYSPSKEITPIYKEAVYENLVIKNNSKYRIADRIKIPGALPRILQICYGKGNIKVDDIMPEENRLLVEGVIEVEILYISEDDTVPFNSVRGAIPFAQTIEVKGLTHDSNYEVKPSLDQLSVMMLDSEEIEAKATISLNTIVFEKLKENIIIDIEVADVDLDKLQRMPGIVGYVVKANDTLWDIAKKYYTTRDSIMAINEMENADIKEGDKLIIQKKVDAIF